MENLDINVYLGKEDGDTLPAEEWNGALGTVQNKVNELVSDSNTAVDYNKLDSSLKSSIDKANSAVLPSTLTSGYYTKSATGMLGEGSVYDQKIDFTGLGQAFTWNDINEMLDDVIKDTTPDFGRNNFRKKLALSGPSLIDIISYLYRNNWSTNTWSQTVEGAISIDGNGQLTAGSKYTKYTRTYTDGDANPSAWEEVGGSNAEDREWESGKVVTLYYFSDDPTVISSDRSFYVDFNLSSSSDCSDFSHLIGISPAIDEYSTLKDYFDPEGSNNFIFEAGTKHALFFRIVENAGQSDELIYNVPMTWSSDSDYYYLSGSTSIQRHIGNSPTPTENIYTLTISIKVSNVDPQQQIPHGTISHCMCEMITNLNAN